MPDKPLIGATKWNLEGIERGKEALNNALACQKAINDRVLRLQASDAIRNEILQALVDQGYALAQGLIAFHELEVIGIQAKQERTNG